MTEPTGRETEAGLSQWQLAWRRFRRHKVGWVGGIIVGLFVLVLIFADFLIPYPHTQQFRQHTYAPPTNIRFFDEEGNFTRPYVYKVTRRMNYEKFQWEYHEDTSVKYPIRFFVRGHPYKLFGLIPMDVHLIGVDGAATIFLFGTDGMGRDLFSRILTGTRVSLLIGPLMVLVAFPLALLLGGISGYYGGGVDMFVQRLCEVVLSLPFLPIILALGMALPKGWTPTMRLWGIVFILAAIGWAGTARVVRGQVLAIRSMDFVEAARAIGARDLRVIARHIMAGTLQVPFAILWESTISFLGVGIHEPMVSWGLLLSSANNTAAIEHYPWLLIPGAFITVVILAFNFLGDALRDAFDPFRVV
jgi:peptide/nickel transport system permease protein